MSELAVTAIGADRPGIIARVSGVLLEHGGNIEDTAMTVLGGHFAMMLLVRCDADPTRVEQDIVAATADLGLVVTVRRVGPGSTSAPATHVLSVYGSDRPGIVHGVTRVLADAGVNVTDVTTRVLGGEGPVYAMLLEIALPDGLDPAALTERVRAQVEDVEISIHALDVETL